jgi:AcrR family transcriptional regulator
MRRRAEQVEQTRERITEATVRLHTTVGPANTSIAAVAEEAGVTRLTVYRHFADLDELFVACRAHWISRNPPPDATAWRSIDDVGTRAVTAFSQLYGWYREHGEELYPIYRDADVMPSSAQQAAAAQNGWLADALVAGTIEALPASRARLLRAVAGHLTGYWTCRSLAIEQGLDDRGSVAAAVRLLLAVVDD